MDRIAFPFKYVLFCLRQTARIPKMELKYSEENYSESNQSIFERYK